MESLVTVHVSGHWSGENIVMIGKYVFGVDSNGGGDGVCCL